MTTETKAAIEYSSTKSTIETLSVGSTIATSSSSRLPTLNPEFDHGNKRATEQVSKSSWIQKSILDANLATETSTIAFKTVTTEKIDTTTSSRTNGTFFKKNTLSKKHGYCKDGSSLAGNTAMAFCLHTIAII